MRLIKKHDLFMQYHLSPKHILTSCGTHIASNHASTTAAIYFANKLTLTRLNIIISKIFTLLHHTYCCYVYIPVQPVCTSLLILLFIKSTLYCIAYFTHYFLPIFMFILLCCVTYFALSIERTWPNLHFTTDYILYNWVCDESWTLNLEPWNQILQASA